MIYGTGIDIIETSRVKKLMESPGSRFIDKWFSREEISYCSAMANPHIHYAARLAAKEAVVKALRLVWDRPPSRRDISITNDEGGAPCVVLNGHARETAERLGVRLHVSLSHCREYAAATVIAET